MAYIKVDHSELTSTANTVDTYVQFLKSKMNLANTEVIKMSANWQGVDYEMFRTEWNQISQEDSTYNHMINALESYSKFLKSAGELYRNAQARAVNRAQLLPKY